MRVDEHLNGEGIEAWKLEYIPDQIEGAVVDLGAGLTQPYRALLQERAGGYIGIDVRGGMNLPLDICATLPFGDKVFAFAWVCEVLDHLDDPNRAWAEARRVAEHGVAIWTGPPHPNFYADIGHRLADIEGMVILASGMRVAIF